MSRMATALAAAFITISAVASAETAFEMVFRGGTLDEFDVGDRLTYASAITAPSAAQATDASSKVSVELENDGRAALEERTDANGGAHLIGEFDATVGNPLAMYFLERTVRSVSEATGGSGFYLRNRIKDALRAPADVREVQVDWRGQAVGATEIILAPFVGDPNLARLGEFGDLRISLVVGDGIPGWYHTLRAESGDGAFASVLSLEDVAE